MSGPPVETGPREYRTPLPLTQNPELGGEGSIELISSLTYEALRGFEGFFSSTFYYDPLTMITDQEQIRRLSASERRARITMEAKIKFYEQGIYAYLCMIHNTITAPGRKKEEFQFPAENPWTNWGYILYTNHQSVGRLRGQFPLELWPNLVFCVVDWPRYTIPEVGVEPSIMRVLRYQATELFPTSMILIRDADTIFPAIVEQGITDALPGYSPVHSSEENRRLESEIMRISQWERNFINEWKRQDPEKGIVLGTHFTYYAEWHRNFPLEVALTDTFSCMNDKEFLGPFRALRKPGDFIYYSPLGIYAGFINVSQRFPPEARIHLWTATILWLNKRFCAIEVPEKGKTIISNEYAGKLAGHRVGKDERVVLFEWCRLFLPTIRFFWMFFGHGILGPEHLENEMLAIEPVIIYKESNLRQKMMNVDWPRASFAGEFERSAIPALAKGCRRTKEKGIVVKGKAEEEARAAFLQGCFTQEDLERYFAPGQNAGSPMVRMSYDGLLHEMLEGMFVEYMAFRRAYNQEEKKRRFLDEVSRENNAAGGAGGNQRSRFFLVESLPGGFQDLVDRELAAAPAAAAKAAPVPAAAAAPFGGMLVGLAPFQEGAPQVRSERRTRRNRHRTRRPRRATRRQRRRKV
jgi:hypothetical protein